jgi:hypothetical protein
MKTMCDVMQIGNYVLEEPAASTFRVEGTTAYSFSTLAITCHTIQHDIPEDRNVHLTLSLNTSVTTLTLLLPIGIPVFSRCRMTAVHTRALQEVCMLVVCTGSDTILLNLLFCFYLQI